MDPRVDMAALAGRVAYQVVKEKLTDPRPTTLRGVPPSPEHLTDEWLTSALCDGVPGARVTGHTLGDRDDGTSARRSLTVTYNEAGRAAGLESRLFTKSGPTFRTRLVAAAGGLGKIESSFYAFVRPELEIEAPPTRYAAFDPVSNRQMLIIDDMTRTVGAEFANVLTRTLTKAQAQAQVDTLAVLHGRFWQAPLQKLYGTWLGTSYEWQAQLNATMGARKRILSGFERGREVIPPRLYARRDEIFAAMMRSLEVNLQGPQTLLHCDVHPGNWYITRDGKLGLADWQCPVQGGWALDLTYLLATNLTPEQRREWERELVARHDDRLAEAGITPPTDSFLEYRQQVPHAIFMWLATLGRMKGLQREFHAHDVTIESVRRICIAADDLETLDAINERPRSAVAA